VLRARVSQGLGLRKGREGFAYGIRKTGPVGRVPLGAQSSEKRRNMIYKGL
jgi:hypothetical protein